MRDLWIDDLLLTRYGTDTDPDDWRDKDDRDRLRRLRDFYNTLDEGRGLTL